MLKIKKQIITRLILTKGTINHNIEISFAASDLKILNVIIQNDLPYI
jgi:hypothetical protein